MKIDDAVRYLRPGALQRLDLTPSQCAGIDALFDGIIRQSATLESAKSQVQTFVGALRSKSEERPK